MVAVHDAAVGEHDLCADEAIAGQPVLAPEQTDPAAEGEAGDADGGTAPGRQGPAVGVQRRVHLCQAGAGSDRGDPVVGHARCRRGRTGRARSRPSTIGPRSSARRREGRRGPRSPPRTPMARTTSETERHSTTSRGRTCR